MAHVSTVSTTAVRTTFDCYYLGSQIPVCHALCSLTPPPPDMDSVGESLDTLSGFLSLRSNSGNSTMVTPLDSKAVRGVTAVTVYVVSESAMYQ